MQDGVLTTAGVLAGLSGAVSDHSQVMLAALASTAAGALSMGAGAYLGTRAETEVLRGELELRARGNPAAALRASGRLLDELEQGGPHPRGRLSRRPAAQHLPERLPPPAEEKIFGLAGVHRSAMPRSTAS